MSCHRFSIRFLACFVCTYCPYVAAAQDALEEIVVTADFRERELAELPASISVLDADDIAARSASHVDELVRLVPNLNFAGGSNRPRYFQIRGTGERSQYEGAPNPSVGFLVDNIDFSGIGGIALSWDLQQVEVLRGPQGTRYGANALAGLINVTSAEPETEWRTRARVGSGSAGASVVGAMVTGPLTDTVAVRFSGFSHRADGHHRNAYLGVRDTNGRDEAELRAKLLWQPSQDWVVNLTGLYVDLDNGYDAFAIDNGYTTYSDRPGRDNQRTRAAALRVSRENDDGARFVSITTFALSDIRFGFDADWGNDEFWSPYGYDYVSDRDRRRETIGQELRWLSPASSASKIDWLAGIYALKLREDLRAVDQGVYIDPVFGAFVDDAPPIESDYSAVNSAVFGELGFALSERVRVTAGLRLERREARYSDSAGTRARPAETMAGGHAGIDLDLTEVTRLYARVARGYKAGGFNLGEQSDERREFGAEFLWNAEVGLNTRSPGGAMDLRAALFVEKRADQQVSTSYQLDPGDPSSFRFIIDNAARGRGFGAELEARARLTPRLKAFANLGLLETEIRLQTPDASLDGRAQAHAPRYSFSAGLSWNGDSGWFAGADISSTDRFYFSNSHNRRSWSYSLLNARLGFASDNWRVSLSGTNLTDRRYPVRGFFFGNEPPDFAEREYVRLGERRAVLASAEFGF